MASLTFGSVGDIIAICQICTNIVKSLSNSRGSAAEYQALITELQGLAQTVHGVRELLDERPQLRHNQRLQLSLNNCRDCLLKEFEQTEPYRATLQSTSRASLLQKTYRKIRWLSAKKELAGFRATIASHVLAISLVLQTSGIDISYDIQQTIIARLDDALATLQVHHTATTAVAKEIESSTTAKLDDGFLRLRNDYGALTIAIQDSEIAAATRLNDGFSKLRTDQATIVKTAVKETETTLTFHQNSNKKEMQAFLTDLKEGMMEEIKQELGSLRLEVDQYRALPQTRHPMVNRDMPTPQLASMNEQYVKLVIKLLTELASFGLIGFYQFLAIMQLIFSRISLSLTPQAKCLLVQDAILRQFVIDVDHMSHEHFVNFIREKFVDTPGGSIISSGNYFFEDRSNRPLNLAGVWSSHILAGRTVYQRVYIKLVQTQSHRCPKCGDTRRMDKEDTCKCGLRFRSPPIGSSITFNKAHPEKYKPKDLLENQDLVGSQVDPNDSLSFFKRVECHMHEPILIKQLEIQAGADACRCGDACECLACPVHPFNATTRNEIQKLSDILEEDLATEYVAQTLPTPNNELNEGVSLSQDFAIENAFYFSADVPFTQSPSDHNIQGSS